MFISLQQVGRSLHILGDLHPFFGISFLAFKKARILIGKTQPVIFSQIANVILDKHFRASATHNGYYIPFATSDKSNRWRAFRYGSTSLQRITTDTFSDSLIHQKNTQEWGWEDDYIERLQNHLAATRLPAFDLSVWLFRDKQWPSDVTPETVRDHLFQEFNINEQERSLLFDESFSNLLPDWLSDKAFTEAELLQKIGLPPGAVPEEGAALQYLELREIGPAEFFRYEPADRLNIITGDNSLGKTFILESIWWALTGEWLGYAPTPRKNAPKSKPQIAFAVSVEGGRTQEITATYNWEKQSWPSTAKRNTLPGLVIYARYDGSFAVWDPARSHLVSQDNRVNQGQTHLFFSRDCLWDGLAVKDAFGKEQWLCNGLIRDWVAWQTGSGERHKENYASLISCLQKLSPSGVESLKPGEPIRLSVDDAREFPTLNMPYGNVPVVHASAGVQRIIGLAYLMVWAWQTHVANSALIRRQPQRRLVLIIDEVEAHLHPFWQRVIVPALMEVVSHLAINVSPQIHLATHSPMVMASAETIFEAKSDALHHLKLENGAVSLEDILFTKRGRADLWLMSEVFGLEHPRSLPAEKAIEDAKKLQASVKPPTAEAVQAVNANLVKYLAQDDDFWPRWRYFAKQHGSVE